MTVPFKSSITPIVREEILEQLGEIESCNNVQILFAIESGSRAWGFPSPDSDYDVRFIYAHQRDWYLSLTPGRDVIELPIKDDLDINGWDVRKALELMLKPNPVMLEWLSSPIRYQWNEPICQKLIGFSQKVAHGTACLNHYLSLADKQWNRNISGKDAVKIKKYFYVARPAMNIRWLRLKPGVIPPMNFQALMEGLELDGELSRAIEKLLVAKSESKELGLADRIPVIDDFIKFELDWAKERVKTISSPKIDVRLEADDLFRQIIQR